MVLYEFTGICRGEISKLAFAKFLRSICVDILNKGGVIRSIEHHGMDVLPYPIKNDKGKCYYGRYWSINFNSSPFVIPEFRKALKYNPECLRSNILKKGTSLRDQTLEEVFTRTGLPNPMPGVLKEVEGKIRELDASDMKLALESGSPKDSIGYGTSSEEVLSEDALSEGDIRLLARFRGLDIKNQEHQQALKEWKEEWQQRMSKSVAASDEKL